MTKTEETRFSNLSYKQGFETLKAREFKELRRLFSKKSSESEREQARERKTH